VTLTISSPENIYASYRQQIKSGDGNLVFIDTGTVSPFWWGATADGLTVDTNAIQAALTSGCDVFFPGTDDYYNVDTILTLGADYQVVFGEGSKSLVIQSGTNVNSSCFYADSRTGVVFKDLYVKPGTTTATTADGYAFVLKDCTRGRVENCEISNHRRGAIFLYGSNDCVVTENFIHDSVVNPATEQHDDAGTDIFIGYSSASNNVVSNNVHRDSCFGIKIQTITSGTECYNNTIIGNTIDGMDGYGIFLYVSDKATDKIENTVISGNTVRNVTGSIEHSTFGYIYGAGIYVQGAEYTTVSNNAIDSVATDSNIVETLSPAGIGVANCREITISGNVILDSGYHGIMLADPNQNGIAGGIGVVTGNLIRNPDNVGIKVKDFPTANITGNAIYGSAAQGIYILDTATTDCDFFTITGNTCNGTSSVGIHVADGGATITGNTCKDNSTTGIYVDGTDQYTITSNVCRNNGVRDIHVTANPTSTIVCNNISDSSAVNFKIDAPTMGIENNIALNGTNFQGGYIPFRVLVDDATPTIKHGKTFVTGGTTTITDFDDGTTGQIIVIIAAHTITITDGTNILLNGSGNYNMTPNDTLTLICRTDGKWSEIGRQVD